jgi:hypothetical protein
MRRARTLILEVDSRTQKLASPPPAVVVALCGLPASGKSTLARSACALLNAGGVAGGPSAPPSPARFDAVVVSFDDELRAAAAAAASAAATAATDAADGRDGWSPEAWHASRRGGFARVAEAVGAAAAEAAAAASPAAAPHPPPVRVVFVDDNAWLRSMRRTAYCIARDGKWLNHESISLPGRRSSV